MLWGNRRRKAYPQIYDFCYQILGFRPKNMSLYHTALMHRSHSAAVDGHKVNNERLEYLGDAVLSTVVADYLYRKYPLQGEGYMTVLRSKIVSRANLNKLSRTIGLLQLVEYDQSGSMSKSMGGDAFEALVGAIYLDCGYRKTQRILVDRVLCQFMNVDELAATDWNFKSKLIDWGQKNRRKVQFEVVGSNVPGANGRKLYECRVCIDGVPQQSGTGYTIKSAEQMAAEKTYKQIVTTETNTTDNEKAS